MSLEKGESAVGGRGALNLPNLSTAEAKASIAHRKESLSPLFIDMPRRSDDDSLFRAITSLGTSTSQAVALTPSHPFWAGLAVFLQLALVAGTGLQLYLEYFGESLDRVEVECLCDPIRGSVDKDQSYWSHINSTGWNASICGTASTTSRPLLRISCRIRYERAGQAAGKARDNSNT